jgi:hypothetical protein
MAGSESVAKTAVSSAKVAVVLVYCCATLTGL